MSKFIKIPIEKIEILISRSMELRNNQLIRALKELEKEYIDKEYLAEVLTKAIEAMDEVDKSFMAVLTMLKDAETVEERDNSPIIIEEEEDDEEEELFEGENEIIKKIEQLQESNPATYDYLTFVFEKGGKGFTSDFKDELGKNLQSIYDHERILEENGLLKISKRIKGSGKRRLRYVTIPEEVFIVLESLHSVKAGMKATSEYNIGQEGCVGDGDL
jgi:hypothetical protein